MSPRRPWHPALMLSAAVLLACSVREPGSGATRPYDMGLGLRSYDSPERVREVFQVTPVVIADEKVAAQDRCPRLDQLSLEFPDRVDRGMTGRARATFVNGKLVDLRFFPVDYDGYISSLKETGAALLTAPGDLDTESGVHSWTASAPGGSYIGWEDVELKKEVQDWVRRCT